MYCSRNRVYTIASRNDRLPIFSVYQLGRGSEPVMVVGRTFPLSRVNMAFFADLAARRQTTRAAVLGEIAGDEEFTVARASAATTSPA